MDSSDKSVKRKEKCKVKRCPPFVLPNVEERDQMIVVLNKWLSTCNQYKWNLKNINSKTKQFLPRNGFHLLFWSALIIDENIKTLIDTIFADNIKYISDNEFESIFGMSVDTNAIISRDQLFANYFLLFSLPAKSHTEYLYEWTKRRLDAWTATIGYFTPKLTFDAHQELFIVTKRRFYVYKQLVPALTRFALNAFNTYCLDFPHDRNPMKEMFRQIKIAISYSGLQVFYISWNFSQNYNTKAMDLESVKEDINRITEARNIIVDKYGENMLPFARLLNYPEVNGLNRCNFPDLAVCAKHVFTKDSLRESLVNLKFRKIKTKTSVDQLKRLAAIDKPFVFKPFFTFTDEEKEIFLSLGLFPDSETFTSLTTFSNPFSEVDFEIN